MSRVEHTWQQVFWHPDYWPVPALQKSCPFNHFTADTVAFRGKQLTQAVKSCKGTEQLLQFHVNRYEVMLKGQEEETTPILDTDLFVFLHFWWKAYRRCYSHLYYCQLNAQLLSRVQNGQPWTTAEIHSTPISGALCTIMILLLPLYFSFLLNLPTSLSPKEVIKLKEKVSEVCSDFYMGNHLVDFNTSGWKGKSLWEVDLTCSISSVMDNVSEVWLLHDPFDAEIRDMGWNWQHSGSKLLIKQ